MSPTVKVNNRAKESRDASSLGYHGDAFKRDSLHVGSRDVELQEPHVLEVRRVGDPPVGQQPGSKGTSLGGSRPQHAPQLLFIHLLFLQLLLHGLQEVERVCWREPDTSTRITNH